MKNSQLTKTANSISSLLQIKYKPSVQPPTKIKNEIARILRN